MPPCSLPQVPRGLIYLRISISTPHTAIRRNVMHVASALGRAAVGIHFFAATIVTTLLAAPAAANEALKWNETTVRAAIVGGQNPIQQTRTVAMVQGAVHDALNAIKPRYAAYYFEGPAAAGAAPEAAVAAASHTVLMAVLPAFGTPQQQWAAKDSVEEAYRAGLAAVPEGQ